MYAHGILICSQILLLKRAKQTTFRQTQIHIPPLNQQNRHLDPFGW